MTEESNPAAPSMKFEKGFRPPSESSRGIFCGTSGSVTDSKNNERENLQVAPRKFAMCLDTRWTLFDLHTFRMGLLASPLGAFISQSYDRPFPLPATGNGPLLNFAS